MALSFIPHNALDIVPVPAHQVFCKVCNAVHKNRAQLCPASRLDICAVHKTVFVPHEKSIYYPHLLDVDTECPDCMFGSDKKRDKALARSNSQALRAAIMHKDVVFCTYCWNTASKKCTHLASCREHSCVYLRSQVDINSKWWLRPSDFACHLCPTNGIMARKAQEWKKTSLSRPRASEIGKEWEPWKTHFSNQIMRFNPGAFQSQECRVAWISWMDRLAKNEMFYLRYLAYQGEYPISILYAETGTVPTTVDNPQLSPIAGVITEPPPPPYIGGQPTTAQFGYRPEPDGTDASFSPVFGHVVPPVPASPQLPAAPVPLRATLQGQMPMGGPGVQVSTFEQGNPSMATSPRHPNVRSMHSRRPSHPSQIRAPQFQTAYPPGSSHAALAHLERALQEVSVGGPVPPSRTGPPPAPLPISSPFLAPRRSVSMNVPQPNPMASPYIAPASPALSHASYYSQPQVNSMLANYLSQVQAARGFPAQRPPVATIPGAFPNGRPADDDWETISEISAINGRESRGMGSPLIQSPLRSGIPPYPQPPFVQVQPGVVLPNPMYATFQQAFANSGGPTQYPAAGVPMVPMGYPYTQR